MRRLVSCAAKTVLLALALGLGAPAAAQVSPEPLSYPVGLDPDGDNFLALRSLPSGTEGVRLARLGPDTLFTEVGRRGGWVNIRLPDGQTGWVSSRYVGCCRTAAAGPAAVSPRDDAARCDGLWSERNAIFKAAGYCFRSQRGLRECRMLVRRRGGRAPVGPPAGAGHPHPRHGAPSGLYAVAAGLQGSEVVRQSALASAYNRKIARPG